MINEILKEIDKDGFRQNLRRYTWQAYHMLPEIKNPSILDLGCGSGVPTIELAVLSKGRITAVDTDKAGLASLKEKANALALTGHITTRRLDFEKLNYRKGCFDIVWSEGSVAAIGFENGLKAWRRFLKPAGFLVIHDEIKDYKHKLETIPSCGYELIGHFIITADIWFHDYFKPLQQRINELKEKYAEKPRFLDVLKKEECENEIFKSRPNDFASIFYIMRLFP